MKYRIFRALADTYESIQKNRIEGENRLRSMFQGVDESEPVRLKYMDRLAQLKSVEDGIRADMHKEMANFLIYTEFFQFIKGIGPTLGAKILGLELNYKLNISSWNAYFALVPHYWKGICEEGHKRLYPKRPLKCKSRVKKEDDFVICGVGIIESEHIENQAPKRERGWKGFWNPQARKLAYNISTSFVRTGKFYREEYERYKIREKQNRPDLSNGRQDNSARRKTVQLFLSHTHQAMNELNGEEYREPYQFEYLQHTRFIDWKEVVKYDKAKKKVSA